MKYKFMLFCACAAGCFFSCRSKSTSSDSGKDALIVATSSWTAAYAQAAGAENIIVLAPVNMIHPSEYELRPSDIPKLMNASVIVYAGYEVMTERLKKGLDLSPDKMCLVKTEYDYETIEQSVMAIAVRLGTEDAARENLLEIRNAFDEGRKIIAEKYRLDIRIVAHRLHAPLIKTLGLAPIVFFGPAAPEASEIVAVSKTEALFILDNRHNPVGQPYREILPNALYKQLLNFPGHLGTKTISDVIRYNVAQLTSD